MLHCAAAAEQSNSSQVSGASCLGPKQVKSLKQEGQDWLDSNHIKGFYAVTRSQSLAGGAQNAVELTGLGKLSPNMMLLGFRYWLKITLKSKMVIYVYRVHQRALQVKIMIR